MQVKIRAVTDSGHDTTKDQVASDAFDFADRTIDASGLLCPEPLVLCKQAMDRLDSGALVHVIATDPHAEIDFEVFARRTDHNLVRSIRTCDAYHVLIRKA